ncbi:hypothetical protein [Geotoga petraea]|uniref:SIR2-like domain-containing protein n=1 Tax=Geotoga petraea TaxID=28234 RepID=A0A4Z0W1R2_9BACT|nr:hypothetical protein [Geotoga petraea]TGG86655.1 hypothetical protein E4650_10100 [Geotoga petraea]TGG86741.1 hypothetical protein E4650_09910 [Geotoga petraea]
MRKIKVSFLFGAGAEIDYGFPDGGKFALDIFRYDSKEGKEFFKKLRNEIDKNTTYSSEWLPDDYINKNVSSFGKSVYESIIKDTIEHNKDKIIKNINNFDNIAEEEKTHINKQFHINISEIIENKINKNIENSYIKNDLQFIDSYNEGNKLFFSNYFSALFEIYKNLNNKDLENKKIIDISKLKEEINNIIISILELQIGALSEKLSKKINEGLFKTKNDDYDFLDNIGDIIRLNYRSVGLMGLNYIMKPVINEYKEKDNYYIFLFYRRIVENIYSSVLDYKTLIDSNWRYLYYPKDEWAKFCKTSIFLYTVRNYIINKIESFEIENKSYYDDLKKNRDKIIIQNISTTNYHTIIEKKLDEKIIHLNGSTDLWYDPYLNIIDTKDNLLKNKKHFIVPLLYTQSGTKPMTSISMLLNYVKMYKEFKESNIIAVVGFGFNTDDEHINGILRTLVDIDDKELYLFDVDQNITVEKIAKRLKVENKKNIKIFILNKKDRTKDDKLWIDYLKKN